MEKLIEHYLIQFNVQILNNDLNGALNSIDEIERLDTKGKYGKNMKKYRKGILKQKENNSFFKKGGKSYTKNTKRASFTKSENCFCFS